MEINSVNDFIQKCFSYKNRLKNRNDDEVLFFRGENTEYPKLLPSIYQSQYDINEEDRIFKEIVAAFPEEMLAKRTTIEKLIFMQHQELPTRLLDISKNPLVGLFFACYREQETEQEKDGWVHVFSVPMKDIKFCDSDSVCLVANISKRPASFSIKGIDHLDVTKFNKQIDIEYLIHEARSDKPEFQNYALPETLKSVICLHPVMNNPRIIQQDGYFFLFGIDGDKKHCARINPGWIVEKVRILADAKKSILEELDFLNINESFLFADYKHLSAQIQKRYRKG